jgi:hypothetical protein
MGIQSEKPFKLGARFGGRVASIFFRPSRILVPMIGIRREARCIGWEQARKDKPLTAGIPL